MNWINTFIIFAIGAGATFILSPAIISLCLRFGFLDLPGEHKRHRFPTPNLGGIALFLGFWAAVAFAYFRFPALSLELGKFHYHIFAGGIIIFLTGLLDDLSELPALGKLVMQIAAGAVLYLGGLQITILFIPFVGPTELGYMSFPVTMIWIVGIINCINLIDGLDGLAAGVSAMAALPLLLIGIYFNLTTVVVFCTAIIGISLAFMYFNQYPARIFMGDSGSLFLGYIFAVISLLFPIKSYTTAAVFVPILALAIPITETVVSFIRRTLSGGRFYRADNRHLFHYLAASGLSKLQVVWLFYILSGFFAVFSGAMFIFNKQVVVTILAVFMVVIFAILFRFRLMYLKKNGREGSRHD